MDLKLDSQPLVKGEQEGCCFDSEQYFIACFKAFREALFISIVQTSFELAVAEIDTKSLMFLAPITSILESIIGEISLDQSLVHRSIWEMLQFEGFLIHKFVCEALPLLGEFANCTFHTLQFERP